MNQLSRGKEFVATFNLPHHDVSKSPQLVFTFQKMYTVIPRIERKY